MTEPKVAPYGAWKSPITSDLIVSGTIGLGRIVLDGDDTYWTEMRPAERGRYVIVRRTASGQISDITPSPFSARTRVHEYGGGSYSVLHGVVYFSNFADQRLYRLEPGAEPHPTTPELDLRYADMIFDRHHHRLICVREDHTATDREAVNAIVALGHGEARVLAGGYDFYSSPRLSPDGRFLAWLSWRHPNMPWDGTELWTAEIAEDGALHDQRLIAGGENESIFQPEWSPDGMLVFVSDRTGWWNLYRSRDGSVEPLCPMEAEFGLPQWAFGMRTYGFASPSRAICIYIKQGIAYLGDLDIPSGNLKSIETAFSDIAGIQVSADRAVFVGASPTGMSAIVSLDLATFKTEVLRRASELVIDPGYISPPQAIEFPTTNGLTAHAFFYAPRNRDFVAPDGERPPLLVMSHGGPTAATSPALSLGIQYWTSRGIGVLDVNYGGSTGYGRAYRERLNGQWGVVDVDDCANGALYLAKQGLIDGNRLAITGGSAGGYTTLCALTFRDVFKAGASHFGVSDLEALSIDTHKFESRYSDRLVGPFPEARELYRERSPIHFTDRLSAPVIFFQGLEDKIVPPNQAEMMVEALRAKGLPVAYVAFEGEQHGFRQAAHIKRALDGEFYFYSRVFGFDPADAIEPVAIENL
jgi:dipeptidyl aminopeptidase/acylaminoacyl peptidase